MEERQSHEPINCAIKKLVSCLFWKLKTHTLSHRCYHAFIPHIWVNANVVLS